MPSALTNIARTFEMRNKVANELTAVGIPRVV